MYFGRGHYEEQVCEFISSLAQWFMRFCFKDFLSGALAALLFSGAESLMQFERGHHGEHSYKIYEIWTSGSGGTCHLKKKLMEDGRMTKTNHNTSP